VAVLCVSLPASMAMAQVAAGPRAGAKIEARDQIKVSVWNAGAIEDAYSVSVLVDADGTFEYPTLGRVKALGLTSRELEADLKTRLDKFLVSPQVTVDVTQAATKTLLLSGAVRVPGPQQFAGQTTLFEALTRAGSVNDDAGDEAIIHRGQQAIRVEIYELLNGASMKNNLTLQDGDMITVPKSEPVIVSGYVQTQGQLHVKRNTTIRQVISMANGLSDRGSWRGIKIQRMVDGKKTNIDVKDIDTDIVKPGDTVIVSARMF
jgi:polysaccharide export outer membrane protein